MAINIVVICGNVSRDVVLHEANNPYCHLTVAVNDRKKNELGEWEDDPSFIKVTCFGRTAENCAKYLAKGSKVAVEGRLKTGSYEKDGVTHYTTDVIARNVEFMSKPGEQNKKTEDDAQMGFTPASENDLPF